MLRIILFTLAAFLFLPFSAMGQVLTYESPAVFTRAGLTGFNIPDGTFSASSTIAINDLNDVSSTFNVVGGATGPGVFYGEYQDGMPTGGIIHTTSTTTSDPSVNELSQSAFNVEASVFVYDAATNSTEQ